MYNNQQMPVQPEPPSNNKKWIIIAIVIAVVVVVAIYAVNYFLMLSMVNSLNNGPGSTPNAVGFSMVSPPSKAGNILQESVTIASASTGIPLSDLGLKVVNFTSNANLPWSVYFIFVTPSGQNYTFSSGKWTSVPSSVYVGSGDQITIVSTVPAGVSNYNGYELEVYSLVSSMSISGSIYLQ
ncbi:MAG: hypothetical protein ACP5UL_05385 [Thermoplasmata archaeon]